MYYEILTYGYQHWEKYQLELMTIFKIMTGNNNYYYKPKTTQNKRTPEKNGYTPVGLPSLGLPSLRLLF